MLGESRLYSHFSGVLFSPGRNEAEISFEPTRLPMVARIEDIDFSLHIKASVFSTMRVYTKPIVGTQK